MKKYVDDNEIMLKNRFTELSRRAEEHYILTNTDFLTLAEQDILLSLNIPCQLIGGYNSAERRIAIFGADDAPDDDNSPIECISISSMNNKFSKPLTHRDVLGAVMSLGIERKSTGDIIISDDNTAYLFCLKNIAQYILTNLDSVSHTGIKCRQAKFPLELSASTTNRTINIASERLDSIIAAVYNLSRSSSKELILSQKAYINSRLVTNAGVIIPPGSIVSLRGYGRFIYNGILRTTKKNRLCASISTY